jgi:hypothetical protein
MKIRVLMAVAVSVLLLGIGKGDETNEFVLPADYGLPGCAKEVSWQRCACEICGKTIWEKVKPEDYTWRDSDLIASAITFFDDAASFSMKDNGDGTYSLVEDAPARVEAEKIVYSAEYKVCPYCEQKYQLAFGAAMKKTASSFVAEAKAKESARRSQVAQENTQEELRRVEAQLREYTAQVKKLMEKIAALKKETKS